MGPWHYGAMLAESLRVEWLGAHSNACACPGTFVLVKIGHGVTVAGFTAVIPTGNAVHLVSDGEFFGFESHKSRQCAGHARPEAGGAEALAQLMRGQSPARPLPCRAILQGGMPSCLAVQTLLATV